MGYFILTMIVGPFFVLFMTLGNIMSGQFNTVP